MDLLTSITPSHISELALWGALGYVRVRYYRTVSGGSNYDGPAELPRSEPSIAFPTVTGTTRDANSSATWDDAVSLSVGGDAIRLTGSFTLSALKTLPNFGSGTVFVFSDNAEFQSASNTRIAQNNANVRTITSASGAGAFTFANGAQGWYFCGVKIVASAASFVTNLVNVGSAAASLANMPDNICFDRCILKGDTTLGCRRGFWFDAKNSIIKNSQIYDFKEVGQDSQGILIIQGRNQLISNTFVEGAGENIMLGGTPPVISGAVPEDITFRKIHLYKPMSWDGSTWTVKNLFEVKFGDRILFEQSYLENIFEEDQTGYAALIKSSGDSASETSNVTFRYNWIANAENGITVSAFDNGVEPPANHISIHDIVAEITRPTGGDGRTVLLLNTLDNVLINHNTLLNLSAGGSSFFWVDRNAQPEMTNITVTNNIQLVGLDGPGAEGSGAFADNTGSGSTMNYNCFMGRTQALYGGNNICPATTAAILFTNFAAADYTLQGTSPCKGTGSGGSDMGADVAAVVTYRDAAIAG